MIKQVVKSEWKESAQPISLCTLNFYPKDISEKFGIKFFEYEEFGLGKQLGAVIDIEGVIYWFLAATDESGTLDFIRNDPDSQNTNREALKVTVRIRSIEKDQQTAYDKLCRELQLSKNDIYWHRENLKFQQPFLNS
jgi:hypothetical protein